MTDLRSIEAQLAQIRSGTRPLVLARPAIVGDGILHLTIQQEASFLMTYESSNAETEKFVPASGAASRMFESLLAYRNEGARDAAVDEFFQKKARFPFNCADMTEEEVVHELFENRKWDHFPKGLLPFHEYATGVRSAAEEHLIEAMEYVKGEKVAVHFTVSPEHLTKFEADLEQFVTKRGLSISISYSFQKAETDTVAVDLTNEPVKDTSGNLLRRPAGHGALLENLNERNADIIFIKNIDNVVPEALKGETIRFKKMLAGVLLHYQSLIFDVLARNDQGEEITDEAMALLSTLGCHAHLSKAEIIQKLNRPIRVCGMVKNTGEPGGGPFWVKNSAGESLQIVEGAQVDKSNPDQLAIFESSTHFNPVDVVCGIKDYKGRKFDLLKYRDPNSGFIVQKTYNGQPIKGLELPGLWNGSMADWNTLFVEVPLITFNPVKTLNDLLKPQHQPQ